jgi:hypothetical protein
MEWRHSGSPRPKISECKNPPGKILSRYFGIRKVSSYLFFSKGPNPQSGVLRISVGAIKEIFEEKTLQEFLKRILVLARQRPVSTVT